MNLEKLGYLILAVAGIGWLSLAVSEIEPGAIGAPEGLLGFATVAGYALLLVKALKDRLGSEEDDHYNRTVEK